MSLGDIDIDEIQESWQTDGTEVDAMTETVTVETAVDSPGADDGPPASSTSFSNLPELAPGGSTTTMPEVEFGDTIGEGGSAVVVNATQVPLERRVAAKTLRGDDRRPYDEASMLEEAWVTARLEHPNVVPVYRLGRDEAEDPVLLMKRVEGTSWAELLDPDVEVPLEIEADDPLDRHLDILIEVCHAVEYAHDQGILHRDLKPENVMVGEFGEVYVVDWGLAVALDEEVSSRLPHTSDIDTPAGTPAYIAPEMVAGLGSLLSEQTDVYLLGAILYRIVNDKPPHEGEGLVDVLYNAQQGSELEFQEDVPDRLRRIVERAMARDPDDRHASVEAFRHDVAEFQRERESLRLSAQARERLDDLRDSVETGDTPGPDADPVYEIFGECRFGFEQALEVADHNDQAREGLQESLELMIEYELDHEGYEAASLLLTDLPEPNPELAERVEALGDELEDREEEFEELRDLRRAVDVDRGRYTRSIFVLVMGGLFGLLGLGPRIAGNWLPFTVDYTSYLIQGFVVVAFFAVGFWMGRDALFQNRANRRMIGCLVAVFGVEWLVRFAGYRFDVPLPEMLTVETLMTGMGATLLAATLDWRIGWAAFVYLVAGVGATFALDWVYLINGSANILAMGLLAWAWWPDEPTDDTTPSTST